MRSPAALVALVAALGVARLAPTARAQAQSQETDEDRAAVATLATSVARGKLGGATARELDDYLKDFPDSPSALLLRAEVRRRTGRYEEAAADVDHARRGCNEPALRRAFAVGAFELHFERGDTAACAADLDFGLDGTDPADEAALPLHARRLLLLLDLGSKKEANELYASRFKDARKEAPPRVALEYGRALTALRDLDRAAQILVPVEKALRDARAPDQVDALVLLARLYRWTRAQGDMIPALQAANDALEIDPQSLPMLVERARTRLLRWEEDTADEAASAKARFCAGSTLERRACSTSAAASS